MTDFLNYYKSQLDFSLQENVKHIWDISNGYLVHKFIEFSNAFEKIICEFFAQLWPVLNIENVFDYRNAVTVFIKTSLHERLISVFLNYVKKLIKQMSFNFLVKEYKTFRNSSDFNFVKNQEFFE